MGDTPTLLGSDVVRILFRLFFFGGRRAAVLGMLRRTSPPPIVHLRLAYVPTS